VADYLTRLAQRTLGIASIARPDFAAMPWTANAQPPAAEWRTSDGVVVHTASPPVAPFAREEGRPHVHDSCSSTAIDPVPLSIAARHREDASPAHDSRLSLPRPVALDTHVSSEAVVRTADGSSNERPAPEARPAVRQTATPLGTPVPIETPTAPANMSTAVPRINITIGRIEVRSTRPVVAELQPPRRPRERQLQSLESYLRLRNGERP
jgi:hypothetical protein